MPRLIKRIAYCRIVVMKKIISILIWAGIVIVTVGLAPLYFLISTLSYFFDPDRKIAHYMNSTWALIIIRINPFWECRWYGLENIDKDRSYVIVSNHQSYGDILMLFGLWMPFRWVSKKSVFYVPLMGWAMSMAGYIKLERDSISSIKKCIDQSVSILKRGISVLMFPEGTRSRDGRVGRFKNGAFKMSIRAEIPILPVVIVGTRDAIPRETWVFNHRVKARLLVKPPVDVSEYSMDGVGELRERVRKIIIEGKEEVEKSLEEEKLTNRKLHTAFREIGI